MKHFIIILILVFGACSPEIRVYSDHDPSYQVGRFGTFNWAEIPNVETNRNPLYYNELNDKRIKSAILIELISRGYAKVDSNPDLVIHYHIVVDDHSVIATEPYGYNYGQHWIRTRTHVYSYRQGTLVIDLMDPEAGQLVWRGWATTAIDTISPEQTETLINRAVEKIFRRFPFSTNVPEPSVSRRIE